MKPKKIKVFTFSTTDDNDPDFYAMREIERFLNTEKGEWLVKHSNPKLEWKSEFAVVTYTTNYVVSAYLTPELYTFWKLKYE